MRFSNPSNQIFTSELFQTKSMRGIRLPFSNQLINAQDLQSLQQIDGIDAIAPALLLWKFAQNGFRTIMQLTAEAFVQTLAGGVLGILIGYFISFLLGFLSITIPVPWELNPVPAMAKHAQAASQIVRLPVSVSLSFAATAMGLSVIIGCVIGYVTAWRTLKMKPVDILRQL